MIESTTNVYGRKPIGPQAPDGSHLWARHSIVVEDPEARPVHHFVRFDGWMIEAETRTDDPVIAAIIVDGLGDYFDALRTSPREGPMSQQAKLEYLVRLALIDWAIANISVCHRKQQQAEAALSSLGDVLSELAARIELPLRQQ